MFKEKQTNDLFYITLAKTARKEELMFQNVAYRPTVFKTGNRDIKRLTHSIK